MPTKRSALPDARLALFFFASCAHTPANETGQPDPRDASRGRGYRNDAHPRGQSEGDRRQAEGSTRHEQQGMKLAGCETLGHVHMKDGSCLAWTSGWAFRGAHEATVGMVS